MVKPDISQHLKLYHLIVLHERMDERIEQMFKVINNILVNNTQCIERNLIMTTYDVISLNRSTGIIEWIPNTIPIKSLIEDSMKRLKIKPTIMQIIINDYIQPFQKIVRKSHSPKMYTHAIQYISKYHKKLLDSFHKTQNRLPQTTL